MSAFVWHKGLVVVSGNFVYTDNGGEQTVYELVNTTKKVVYGIWLDLVNMTQNGTIKIYYKIDGINYREIVNHTFAVATDSDGVLIDLAAGIKGSIKITYTEGGDETAPRTIPYIITYEARE